VIPDNFIRQLLCPRGRDAPAVLSFPPFPPVPNPKGGRWLRTVGGGRNGNQEEAAEGEAEKNESEIEGGGRDQPEV
jgi:hypothetical protein